MKEKKIRRVNFDKRITFAKYLENNIILVFNEILHILNFYGEIYNDIPIGNIEVNEILYCETYFFIIAKNNKYYYFTKENTKIKKLNFKISKFMVAGNKIFFSHNKKLSVLNPQTFNIECVYDLPKHVLDFTILNSIAYIVFNSHVCSLKLNENNNKNLKMSPIEKLSHLSFTSISTNKKQIIILEKEDGLFINDTKKIFWFIKKPKEFINYMVSENFLILFSDFVEIYNLFDKKLFARFYTRTNIASFDENRRKLWLYSNALYEIDVSEPFEIQNYQ